MILIKEQAISDDCVVVSRGISLNDNHIGSCFIVIDDHITK